MEKRHQEFIRSHLPELTEFVPVEERRYPSQEVGFGSRQGCTLD